MADMVKLLHEQVMMQEALTQALIRSFGLSAMAIGAIASGNYVAALEASESFIVPRAWEPIPDRPPPESNEPEPTPMENAHLEPRGIITVKD